MTGAPFVSELALAGAAAPPAWIHLLPSGEALARDGRRFVLAQPEAVIATFEAGKVDLPVDYEHQADRQDSLAKGPVPAAGWIKKLELRADGIWGNVEWTATAARMIAEKEYRYISPTLIYNGKTLEVLRLKGAALVHHPALELTALASQETSAPPPAPADDAQQEAPEAELVQVIRDLFGMAPETPVSQLIDALKALVATVKAEPDPAKYMPVSAVQAMMAERQAEEVRQAEDRAHSKVNAAFRAGYIHGGMRDWALSLCRADEQAFDTFLASTGPVYGRLLKSTHTAEAFPARPKDAARSEAEAIVCAQLGLKPGSL